jgi:hypothetical protein
MSTTAGDSAAGINLARRAGDVVEPFDSLVRDDLVGIITRSL